jgi:hypothetical protein
MLLAWGPDLAWEDEAWSNARAKHHARSAHVRAPFRLRVNAYRVLLTRGRDGTVSSTRYALTRSRDGAVIFVPPLAELEATAARLEGHGVKALG